MRPVALILAAWVVLAALPAAAVSGSAGPYTVDLTTRPDVVPVGKAKVDLAITDSSGKPVEGATVRLLAKMPTMVMGEKETTAAQGDTPGHYTTEAVFMMAGDYEATVTIEAAPGKASVRIPLQTGRATGAASSGPPWTTFGGIALGILVVLFTLFRMVRTGQKPSVRPSAGAVGGLLLLGAMLAVVVYAVNHWRRPGAMTPIEAQAMEMNTPAPPGVSPVMLATAGIGKVSGVVRYTGQVAGYNEQDLVARTTGRLMFMPLYAGDRVTTGQVLARLDTTQADPDIAQQRAGLEVASREVDTARSEVSQAEVEVNRAKAELAAKQDAVAASGSEIEAARSEKAAADSDMASMLQGVPDAKAALESASATDGFRQAALKRTRALAARGAVSAEELHRDESAAAESEAALRQAGIRVIQAEARYKAGQAMARKATAMLAAAESRSRQMSDDVMAAKEAISSAESMLAIARSKARGAAAGAKMAQGVLASATVRRDWATLQSPITGVVTQRLLAPGVLVTAGQPIVRLAQLKPVRLQASVAEVDLPRIRLGAAVTAILPSGGHPIHARVTSISPLVDPATRTALVEALVSNQDDRLIPGQFVALSISTGGSASTLRVPNQAVQVRPEPTGSMVTTGVRHYVWIAGGAAGSLTVSQVDVQIGASDGRFTAITGGLKEGDRVVVGGYQSLKIGDAVVDASQPSDTEATSEATVKVSSAGYTPATVTLKAGVPARLTFLRVDEQNCGGELVMKAHGIRRTLPVGKPVVLEFTPRQGETGFACGMDMMHGKVIGK